LIVKKFWESKAKYKSREQNQDKHLSLTLEENKL
jgi:hypothetical protein